MTAFGEAAKDLGIESQSVELRHATTQLRSSKYQVLVLDLDTTIGALPFMESVRKNSENRNAVVLVFATDVGVRDQALREGAHFVLGRPIASAAIRQILNTAYDLMLEDRNRYLRFALETPVRARIHSSGRTLDGHTINISSNGMAIQMEVPLALAETLDIDFQLPHGPTVSATAIVVWADKQGKCGLKITCKSPEVRKRLDLWLSLQFQKKE